MANVKISEYTKVVERFNTDLVDISKDVGGGLFETKSIEVGDFIKPKVLDNLFSPAPTFNVGEVHVHEMPLSGNTAPGLSNKIPGGTYIVVLQTDGVGGYSVTPGASFGDKDDSSEDILSAVANATYIFTVVVRPGGLTFYTINTIGV